MRKRYHHESEFGAGRRVPLCRESRAVFRAKAEFAFRAGRLTRAARDILLALLKRLGEGGQLDPSIATIAADAHVNPSTVTRWLPGLRLLGFLSWTRRLVRDGWRTEQASNAYVLTVPACDMHGAQGTLGLLSKRQTYPQPAPAAACVSDRENAARQLVALGLDVPTGW